MTADDFLKNVRRIADSHPVYRTGGDGSDGTCDCIGLIMGALGGKFDLHSSNYFARFQTANLREINGADELQPGEVVYKAKENDSDLHERYLPGGAYCNGDLRDYYHAGVVASTAPLKIVHCTSSENVNGIAWDSSLGAWRFAGRIMGVSDHMEEAVGKSAVVTVSSGSTVNLRTRPSVQSRRKARVPAGTAVTVLEQADGWAAVVTPAGERGYMMLQFLKPVHENENIETRLSMLEERVSHLERGK